MPGDECAGLRQEAASAVLAVTEAHRGYVIAELGFRAATGSEQAAWVKTAKEVAAAALGGGSKKLLTLLALLESGIGLAAVDPRAEAARLTLQTAVERRIAAQDRERDLHEQRVRCLRRQRRPWRGSVVRTWSTGKVLDRNRVANGVVYYGETSRTGRLAVEILGSAGATGALLASWALDQKWVDRRWGSGRAQRLDSVRQVSLRGQCEAEVLTTTPILVDVIVSLPALAGAGVWTDVLTRDDGSVDFSIREEQVSLGPLRILAVPRAQRTVTGSTAEVEPTWPNATVRTRWSLTSAD